MYIDLLIKLKNAEAVEKFSIKTRHTKMDYAVAEVLNRFGFIKSVEVKGKSYKKIMEIDMNPDRLIRGIKLLSKPSIHRYASYRDFPRVKSGHGLLVVSTSKGIMTGEDAKKEKVGGEMLFEIW
ncbi:30S ribosomal protein S8 [Candidatus Parcubacteria bacterium]|jgi:small subunit ribosomal protein S8|nr:MAG: 30S ribosomal protein S8 [Candidatus Parcubacteria bacterium]